MNSRDVTALITTSPRPIHPSTAILDETIASVRHHLPDAPIIVLADGVRQQLRDREKQYREYLDRITGQDVTVLRFAPHRHQTLMLAMALPYASTPLVLVQEDDLPLRTDVPIDWDMIASAITVSRVDSVRFMLMESIHPEHEHLMLGPVDHLPLIKTRQFSGNVHIASTDFYRRLLHGVTPRVSCYLEGWGQGRIETGPWEYWKLAIYVPDPLQARRLYHLDGRAHPDDKERKDPNFLELQVYQ